MQTDRRQINTNGTLSSPAPDSLASQTHHKINEKGRPAKTHCETVLTHLNRADS